MKIKAISEQKSSTKLTNHGQSEWHYPKTRQQALQMKDVGVRISLERGMAANLVNFLQSIGADNDIPAGKSERVSWLNHFHNQLAVNNPLWPTDMSFEFVYSKFVNAIMYDHVELRGHNIHAFITAFKKWITQSGVMDNLREQWFLKNPDKQPKQLLERVSIQDPNSTEWIDGLPVEEQPEEVIIDQYQKIMKIMNDDNWKEWLKNLGGNGYIKKILNEAKRRNLTPTPTTPLSR